MATYEDFITWLEKRIEESKKTHNKTDERYYDACLIDSLANPERYTRIMKLAKAVEESPELREDKKESNG